MRKSQETVILKIFNFDILTLNLAILFFFLRWAVLGLHLDTILDAAEDPSLFLEPLISHSTSGFGNTFD